MSEEKSSGRGEELSLKSNNPRTSEDEGAAHISEPTPLRSPGPQPPEPPKSRLVRNPFGFLLNSFVTAIVFFILSCLLLTFVAVNDCFRRVNLFVPGWYCGGGARTVSLS